MNSTSEAASVPILRLWDLVVVPVQGELDDDQWDGLTGRVLHAVVAARATGLVLDVTGVSVLDSHMVSVIGNLACAAQLMGTQTTLVGMTPAITMTLVEMGIDLQAVRSTRDLEAALTDFGVCPGARPRVEGVIPNHASSGRRDADNG